MKIYLAGPDVFRPDVVEWAQSVRALCQRYGYEALLPIDHGETLPQKIFQANTHLIRKAQVVAANLDSFRGAEPDSGTCFELGFAAALGKKLCGYVTQRKTVIERVGDYEDRIIGTNDRSAVDHLGWRIEDFGLPVNLMLAMSMPIVEGGLDACLQNLRPHIAVSA